MTAAGAGWPRITVVTPSFNQARFLEQCIRSVLDQGYPDLEYLILDGGSTDGSVEIIRRYRSRLAWWVSERDGGQSAAINRGFRRATGELVAWLNSDDYYLPGALHAVAMVARQRPGASFYFGDGLRVGEDGRTRGRFWPCPPVTFNLEALRFGLDYILQPAAFIRRSALAAVGPLDETLRYGMDWDLWLRLAAYRAPAVLQTVLAASREYAGTKTSTGAFARAEELRRIAERHTGQPLTPGALCYLLHTIADAMQRSSEFPPHFVGNVHVISGALIDRLLPRYGMAADCFPRAGGTVEAVLGKLDEADRAVLARELERLRQHRAALAAAHAELEQVRRRSRLPLRKRVTGALLRRLGRLMAAAGRADAAPAARDRE